MMEAKPNIDVLDSDSEAAKAQLDAIGIQIDEMLAQLKQDRLAAEDYKRSAVADHERIRVLQEETRSLLARI
jgi:hypothetical protein